MKEYVLIFLLCFGCICTDQFYDVGDDKYYYNYEDDQNDITNPEPLMAMQDNASVKLNNEPNPELIQLQQNYENSKKILQESDSAEMDKIKTLKKIEHSSTQSEDTVAKVRQDLDEDLSTLYNVWDKLTTDNKNEVPEIFEDVKSKENENTKQDETKNHDIIELDEDDKEHFDEVDFETLFKDVSNEKNQVQEENMNAEKNFNDMMDKAFDYNGFIDEPIFPIPDINDAQEIDKETPTKDLKTVDVRDLSSSEFADLMEQFKVLHADDFDNDKLRDSNPIKIILNETEIVSVTSPNYPNPYPTNQIVDWMIEGDGTGIELNITDFIVNGALGDYVLFKPGGIDDSGNTGIIMSYQLESERKFRFLNVNRMFVRFESKLGMAFRKGFSFNVRMIFPPEDDSTDEDGQPPKDPLPPSHHTLTVYLGGLPFNDFKLIEDDFRNLIADMATIYVHENGIEYQNETSSITRITSTNFCNINWPGFETCVAVTFTVPVDTTADDEAEWKLNSEDLNVMWYTYIYMDPFAARLKRMGIEEFLVPNDSAVLTWWMLVASAVAFAVVALGIVLWRFSCLEDSTRMRVFSDSDSYTNEKRSLDLYPTPHQTLPPLYADINYSWPTEKGDDTSVDMSGYNNANFLSYDLLEFESDDEPAQDRGSINSKDIVAKDKQLV